MIDNDPDSAEMTDVASENANNDDNDNDNDNDKDSDKGNDSDGGDQSWYFRTSSSPKITACFFVTSLNLDMNYRHLCVNSNIFTILLLKMRANKGSFGKKKRITFSPR